MDNIIKDKHTHFSDDDSVKRKRNIEFVRRHDKTTKLKETTIDCITFGNGIEKMT